MYARLRRNLHFMSWLQHPSLLIESLNVQKVLMLSFGKSAEVEFVSNETDVRVLSKQTLQIIRSQFDHIWQTESKLYLVSWYVIDTAIKILRFNMIHIFGFGLAIWQIFNLEYFSCGFTYISSDSDLQRNQWTLSLFLAPMAIACLGLHPAGNSGRLGTRLIHCKFKI